MAVSANPARAFALEKQGFGPRGGPAGPARRRPQERPDPEPGGDGCGAARETRNSLPNLLRSLLPSVQYGALAERRESPLAVGSFRKERAFLARKGGLAPRGGTPC